MINLSLEIENCFKILPPQDSEQFQIEFTASENLSFFNGHFPQQPVLPAVAFIDLSDFFIKSCFKTIDQKKIIQKLPLLKFLSPLLPLQMCTITILKKNALHYSLDWKVNYATIALLEIIY